jgi:hypothetical protein
VYVGSNGTLYTVDPGLTTSSTFSTALAGDFLDGITFDPTGTYLFVATRTGCECLSILRRDGTLVQSVAASHTEPDGIAFNTGGTQQFNNGGPFVVTNNTDGTIVSYVFPNNDYTKVPVQSVFASGGFRGDLTQVGSDNCFYLSQDGVRYADGTVDPGTNGGGSTGHDSIVRICGGIFVPPGPTATPTTSTTAVPPTATATATATQVPPATATPAPAGIGGTWTFKVTAGITTTYWEATIRQGAAGALSGVEERVTGDCSGPLAGALKGAQVTMVWRLYGSCSGEVVYLSGAVAYGTLMTGSVVDNKFGRGTFIGVKDS